MRLPQKVAICGKDYLIRRDRTLSDGIGRGNLTTQIITVGAKDNKPQRAFETFLHEVCELVLVENKYRYYRDGDDGFFYMLDHAEFDKFIADLVISLKKVLKMPCRTKKKRKRKKNVRKKR